MVRPEDDLFHPRNDDLLWNESSFFTFMVPERRLNGYLWFFHRPNMKLSAGGPCLWDPTGEDIYNCLYWDWDTCQPMPANAEMYDFTLRNSLTVTPIELQRSYNFRYARNGCELDLTWESIMEPHPFKSTKSETTDFGVGGWLASGDFGQLSVGHYEQFGRMRGTAQVEGQTYQIDCFAIRDHSWGPRTLVECPRMPYLWGVASEQSSFLAMAASPLPCAEDPFFDTVEPVVYGWYVKDGIRGDLVSGERRVTKRGDDGRPLHQTLSATDHLGRTLDVEGSSENYLKWSGFNEQFDWWGLAEWRYDGQTVWGEAHEGYTYRHGRRLHRILHQRR